MAGLVSQLLAGTYGEGYSDPRLSSDSADASTSDVLKHMSPQNKVSSALDWLSENTPENDEHSLSLANMTRAGAGILSNWMRGNPDIGSDTLAPPGLLGFLGSAPYGAFAANALRRSMIENAIRQNLPQQIDTHVNGLLKSRQLPMSDADAYRSWYEKLRDEMRQNAAPPRSTAESPEETIARLHSNGVSPVEIAKTLNRSGLRVQGQPVVAGHVHDTLTDMRLRGLLSRTGGFPVPPTATGGDFLDSYYGR